MTDLKQPGNLFSNFRTGRLLGVMILSSLLNFLRQGADFLELRQSEDIIWLFEAHVNVVF